MNAKKTKTTSEPYLDLEMLETDQERNLNAMHFLTSELYARIDELMQCDKDIPGMEFLINLSSISTIADMLLNYTSELCENNEALKSIMARLG